MSGAQPPSLLQIGRAFLQQQAFSRLLGAELTVFEPGRAEIVVPVRDELKQQNGFVHGGVVAYLADNTLTYAGGSVLGTAVVTSEFKINYAKPAIGERLIARATVVHGGKRQAVCRCDIFVVAGGTESLCAAAQGTIVTLSDKAAV
ncbi:MAG: PaaI family thioesterase [Alphaproteobacteria bacterium]